MNPDRFNKRLKEIQIKSFEILESKRYDYADAEVDVLSNFKEVTAMAQLFKIDFSQPHHYALLMVLMKYQRLQNLLSKGKTPKNESVLDTTIDAINYAFLLDACILETFESITN